jgi:hypothetical protein
MLEAVPLQALAVGGGTLREDRWKQRLLHSETPTDNREAGVEGNVN